MISISPVADEHEEQLSLDAYQAAWPHERFGLPEVQSFKRQLLDHADLLAREDGALLGSGFAALFHGFPERPTVFVTVPPSRRRRGAGSALYAALSDWARERGLETLLAVVADNDPESLAFAERRGFTEERREKGVSLDLTAIEPPRVDPPAGVEIVTWAERPELAPGLYAVACEAYPDVPGDEGTPMDSYEEWLRKDMEGAGDRPDATFVALVDGEVAGYAKLSLSTSDTKTGYHDMTGVLRAHRGRGIAAALKRAQIAWAKQAGYELAPGLVTLQEALSGPD